MSSFYVAVSAFIFAWLTQQVEVCD